MNIYQRKNPPVGFYVYAYIRSKDSETAKAGTPYYIGKGKGNRATEKHSVKLPANNNCIIVLEQNLSEIGAFAIERRLIKWWGRIDNNTGILRNRTDGGDGTSGMVYTEERNKKISEKLSGRIISDETRKRLSISNLGVQAGEKNGMYGRIHTEKVKSDHSLRMLGNKNSLGRILPSESLLKMSESAKNRQRGICIHCGYECNVCHLKRWHNDNCRYKNGG